MKVNPLSVFFTEWVEKHLEGVPPLFLYEAISPPPSFDLAHQAMGLFPLARFKLFQKGEIASFAQDLLLQMKKKGLPPEVQSLSAHGPYLNISYTPEFLQKTALTLPLSPPTPLPLPKTMVEYSQPNTHKELHVGHMRNLCLGHSLVNLLRFWKVETIAATYPGDLGTHVAKCLWYLKKINREPLPSGDGDRGKWLGEIYTKAYLEFEGLGEKAPHGELSSILHELHQKEGEYFKLWKETRAWSLEQMEEVYRWARVSFDHWFFESEVDEASVALVKKLFSKGQLVKDDGAIGMDLREDKLGFLLLLKKDGTGLYATKDLELARLKVQDFGIGRCLYVVDNRQEYHFKQVFKAIEKSSLVEGCEFVHLSYEMVVELKGGTMSSRQGNIIPMTDLIQRMEKEVKERFLCRYEKEWSDQEIQNTASVIAVGAIKYGMTRMDHNRKIIFDMDEWLKLEGETGPYLQYVCARINRLLEKSRESSLKKDDDQKGSSHPLEQKILLHLCAFLEVLLKSTQELKTHYLCSYLYDLGKLFNQFYGQCPILENPFRIALSRRVLETMEKGLSILGIEAPERM